MFSGKEHSTESINWQSTVIKMGQILGKILLCPHSSERREAERNKILNNYHDIILHWYD